MTNHKLDEKWQAKFKGEWRKAVLYDPNLNMGAKAVGVATLEDYNRTDPKQVGTTFNKADTLAEKMGCGEKAVRNGWKALREAGYLHSLGRSSGGRGVYIHRFDLPESDSPVKSTGQDQKPGHDEVPPQNSPVKSTGQNGQIDRAERSKGPMEQGELNKMNEQVELPTSAHSQVYEHHGVSRFIKEDEPRHRDEFINYLIKIDVPQNYLHVLAIFETEMQGQSRSDWTGTFKSFMAGIVDNYGLAGNGDPLSDAARQVEETEVPRLDKFDHLDFAREWKGHREGVSEDEFRRAWEHAVMHPDSTGTRVVAVAASAHVAGKYPREFGDVIGGLGKFQLSKAVSKIVHLKKEN